MRARVMICFFLALALFAAQEVEARPELFFEGDCFENDFGKL